MMFSLRKIVANADVSNFGHLVRTVVSIVTLKYHVVFSLAVVLVVLTIIIEQAKTDSFNCSNI
jgi:hypothetical protein